MLTGGGCRILGGPWAAARDPNSRSLQTQPLPMPPHTHAHLYRVGSLVSAVDHLRFVPDEFRRRRTTIEAKQEGGRGGKEALLRLRTRSDSKCHVKHIN